MILKIITGAVIITCMNLLFLMYTFIFMRHREHLEHVCTFSDYMKIATSYVQDNNLNSFPDKLPAFCKSPNETALETFQDAIGDLLNKCKQKRPLPSSMESKTPILTLFTTWESQTEKSTYYLNTLQNWSTFLPKINIVLFTNDTFFKNEALSRGWTVLPIIHQGAGGAPVLNYMFKTVMDSFNSTYYGFCNGDILFVENLIETLTILNHHFKTTNDIFFTGRRTNIQNITKVEMSSYDNLKLAAKNRGKLFIISAEDYFITTKSYPWDKTPAFVVGRPVYDNYLVAEARCNRKFVTVDLTDTTLAVHQTTSAGNAEGHHKKFNHYNHELLERMKIKNLGMFYSRGFITCTSHRSIYNLCGDIEILQRPQSPGCKC